MGDVEIWVDLSARRVLDAVVGPEVLDAVRRLNGVSKWLLARMAAGEGDVIVGVPVLCKEDVRESRGEGVDAGNDGVSIRDSERTAGKEVDLHVDDEKRVCQVKGHGHFDVVAAGGRMRGSSSRCS